MEAFDPKNKEHVIWLKNTYVAIDHFMDPNTEKDTKKLFKLINDNTFGYRLSQSNFRDWWFEHSIMGNKYAKSVLHTEDAFVPPRDASP